MTLFIWNRSTQVHTIPVSGRENMSLRSLSTPSRSETRSGDSRSSAKKKENSTIWNRTLMSLRTFGQIHSMKRRNST